MSADPSKPQSDALQATAPTRPLAQTAASVPVERATIASKQALRAELRARRQAMAPRCGTAQAREAGEHLADVLEPLLDWAQVRTAGVYAAVGHELDLGPLSQRLVSRGLRTCYPRVASQNPPRLHFVAVTDASDLVVAPFGLREPAPQAPPLPLSAIDVFFVPGLGFDRHGQRLGQGRGYYDAALREHPAALRVGVCHPCQELSAVPCEPHDERMDLVVTPLGCVTVSGRSRHRLLRAVCESVVPGVLDVTEPSGTACQKTEVKP